MLLKPHALSHDIYRSVINHNHQEVFDIVAKKIPSRLLTVWPTKNPDVFKQRRIIRSYDEAPAGGARIDVIWELTMCRKRVGITDWEPCATDGFARPDLSESDWDGRRNYYIFHEVKTGRFDIEQVLQHYLNKKVGIWHKGELDYIRILGMEAQLWVWGRAGEISRQPRDTIKKGRYRFVPLEYIESLTRAELSRLGLNDRVIE